MNPLDIIELKLHMAGIAELLAAYRDDLIQHGFSRDEALALVVAYQTTIFTAPPRSSD